MCQSHRIVMILLWNLYPKQRTSCPLVCASHGAGCGHSPEVTLPQSEMNSIFSASVRKNRDVQLTGRFLEGVFQKQDPLEAGRERRWEHWSAVAWSRSPTLDEEEARGRKQWVSERRRVESHSEWMESRRTGSIMSRVLTIRTRRVARGLFLPGQRGGLEAQFNLGSWCHSGE